MLGPDDIKKQELENPKPDVDVEVEVKEPKEDKPATEFSTGGEYERMQVAEVLGLTRNDIHKYQDDIDSITKWVKSYVGDDPGNILWEIRHIADKVGKGYEGVFKRVKRYLFLRNEQRQIDAELKRYEL